MATFRPASAISMAAIAPPAPEPITMTSKRLPLDQEIEGVTSNMASGRSIEALRDISKISPVAISAPAANSIRAFNPSMALLPSVVLVSDAITLSLSSGVASYNDRPVSALDNKFIVTVPERTAILM